MARARELPMPAQSRCCVMSSRELPATQPAPPVRWRFSLLRIFLLTTACAVVLALVRQFAGFWLLQVVAGIYFTLIVGYAVLRAPTLFQRSRGFFHELRRIRRERDELRTWVEQRRRDHAQNARPSR